MITSSVAVNATIKQLLSEHAPHVAKPHHVAGYGTAGGLAATLVILNGYSYALITLVCLVLNVITIPIMLQRDIIIPSYIVLTAITLSDMFMALSSLPFNVYFYLFDAYKSFVPFDLCFAQRTFGEVVPSALHTMSIWCTVYLAVHRYREVTTTNTNKRKMSLTGGSASRNDFITVVLHLALVAFFSFFIQCFRFFDTEIIPVKIISSRDSIMLATTKTGNVTEAPTAMISCSMRLKSFITTTIGKNAYFLTFLWCRTICVQILPCTILIFVNVLLIRILNERIEVRKNMMNKNNSHATLPVSNNQLQPPPQQQQLALVDPKLMDANNSSSPLKNKRGSSIKRGAATSSNQQQQGARDPNRGNLALRNWRLITRMLWLIVLITLIVELPFAIWFIYLCIDITAFHFRMPSYVVNIVSSSLNVLLLLTTPLKFFIYYTMIRPFRDKLNSLRSGLTLRLLKHSRQLHADDKAAINSQLQAIASHVEPSSAVPLLDGGNSSEERQRTNDTNNLPAIQLNEIKQPSPSPSRKSDISNRTTVQDESSELTPAPLSKARQSDLRSVNEAGDDTVTSITVNTSPIKAKDGSVERLLDAQNDTIEAQQREMREILAKQGSVDPALINPEPTSGVKLLRYSKSPTMSERKIYFV